MNGEELEIGDWVEIIDIGERDAFYDSRNMFIGMTGTIVGGEHDNPDVSFNDVSFHDKRRKFSCCYISFDNPHDIRNDHAKEEHELEGCVYFVQVRLIHFGSYNEEIDYESVNCLSRRPQ